MQRRSAWLPALVSALLLTGCSHENDGDARAESTPESAVLSVTWTQSQGDIIYMEGSVPGFELTDPGGEVQRSVQANDAWTWDDLAPGSYVLRAGLRPCSGSCDYLDELTDSCSRDVEVDGEVSLHVRLAPGQVCSISDPAAASPAVDLSLDCEGYQWGAGTFDYLPPKTRAEAIRQNWPRTPEAALGGMADPDSRRGERLGIASLSDGVRSDERGRVTVQFAALDREGDTVAVYTVDRLFRGVWSVGQMEECA